jgi:hypothetical protein
MSPSFKSAYEHREEPRSSKISLEVLIRELSRHTEAEIQYHTDIPLLRLWLRTNVRGLSEDELDSLSRTHSLNGVIYVMNQAADRWRELARQIETGQITVGLMRIKPLFVVPLMPLDVAFLSYALGRHTPSLVEKEPELAPIDRRLKHLVETRARLLSLHQNGRRGMGPRIRKSASALKRMVEEMKFTNFRDLYSQYRGSRNYSLVSSTSESGRYTPFMNKPLELLPALDKGATASTFVDWTYVNLAHLASTNLTLMISNEKDNIAQPTKDAFRYCPFELIFLRLVASTLEKYSEVKDASVTLDRGPLNYSRGLLTRERWYRVLSSSRTTTEFQDKFELINFARISPGLTLSGKTFLYTSGMFFGLTPVEVPPIKGFRTYDSGTGPFFFNFETEAPDSWDVQTFKYQAVEYFEQHKEYKADIKKWKDARQVGEMPNWVATFLYMLALKNDKPETYRYLMKAGFGKTCKNIDVYTKECKRFTAHLKFNISKLSREGVDPVALFELEQLAGYQTRATSLPWETNIGEWVSSKNSIATAVASYCAAKISSKLLPRWIASTDITAALNESDVFYSAGSAKGKSFVPTARERVMLGIPGKFPLSKTGYDISLTWPERDAMQDHRLSVSVHAAKRFANRVRRRRLGMAILEQSVDVGAEDLPPMWFGYPIKKQEVGKTRYIVNTCLRSHYMLAPIERVLERSMKSVVPLSYGNDERLIWNMLDQQQQAQLTRKFLMNKRPMTCADQSSFDHGVSDHIFHYMFSELQKRIPAYGQADETVREFNRKFGQMVDDCKKIFQMQRIWVCDETNATQWQSGMLSGWKITSVGDSWANLIQTEYALRMCYAGEYVVVVLGDDVWMMSDVEVAESLASAMVSAGLNQHPEKTIKHSRYGEFLRVLYDRELGVARAYPSRLMPSLVYTKPWLGSYEAVPGDIGNMLSRADNWASLQRRLQGSPTFALIQAADLLKLEGKANYEGLHELAAKLRMPSYLVHVSRRSQNVDSFAIGSGQLNVTDGRVTGQWYAASIKPAYAVGKGKLDFNFALPFDGVKNTDIPREVQIPTVPPSLPVSAAVDDNVRRRLTPGSYYDLRCRFGVRVRSAIPRVGYSMDASDGTASRAFEFEARLNNLSNGTIVQLPQPGDKVGGAVESLRRLSALSNEGPERFLARLARIDWIGWTKQQYGCYFSA